MIDNDFLKMTSTLKINTGVKVFARTSPENKAVIVKKLKLEIENKRKALTKMQRIFSEEI